MIKAALEAFKNGDMDDANRLKDLINAEYEAPGYADDIRINAWGDHSGRIPNPDKIEDRALANRARRARNAVAAAQKAGTIAAHVDAEAELRRIGYTRHAMAIEILSRQLAA